MIGQTYWDMVSHRTCSDDPLVASMSEISIFIFSRGATKQPGPLQH